MKGLAILSLMLGLASFFSFFYEHHRVVTSLDEDVRGKSLAINFALYRKAAWDFAQYNPAYSGVIKENDLILPNWNAQRAWVAQMASGICYVFGPATLTESSAIRSTLKHSQGVGRNVGGMLHPSRIPLPTFIPIGSVVSLMEVQP